MSTPMCEINHLLDITTGFNTKAKKKVNKCKKALQKNYRNLVVKKK